jgi:LPXTG-site transpeptidase (sortase) family protein
MKTPTSFEELYSQVRTRIVPFMVTFFVAVFVSYLVLYVIDFIPESPAEGEKEEVVEPETNVADAKAVTAPEPAIPTGDYALPVKISFDRLDQTVTVLNPTSSTVEALDAALLEGVVRHPASADFSEKGNILILGHSSHLPNVFNHNFQAFNGLETMTWGDKIYVDSLDTEYVYRVEKVYEAKASEVVVPETPGEARLTLATCNNFGSKDDRYIVEAVLVETRAL